MSETKDDGGFAFPHPYDSPTGMSLRDYFAAAALTGICVSDKFIRTKENTAGNAIWAYEIADAMLAARKAKP